MGWLPEQYYSSTPYHVFVAIEGYLDKIDEQQRIHRMAAYRIHQSLVKDPLSIDKFWPVGEDCKPDNPLTREEYNEMMKRGTIE